MTETNGLRFVFGAIFAVLAFQPCASRAEGNQYANAEFTISSDPSAVVLFVQITYPMSSKDSQSMRLFGNGRLELTSSDSLHPEPRRVERALDESAKQALMGLAVHSGLAEWDAERINSEKAIALNGQRLSISDGSVVTVSLVLETYRRDEYERTGISKQLSVATPSVTVRYFPNIPEFKGVLELDLYLRRLLHEEGLD